MPIASYWVISRARPELEGQEAAKSSKSISVSGHQQGLLSLLINETQLSIRGYGVLTASMHVQGVDPAVLHQIAVHGASAHLLPLRSTVEASRRDSSSESGCIRLDRSPVGISPLRRTSPKMLGSRNWAMSKVWAAHVLR